MDAPPAEAGLRWHESAHATALEAVAMGGPVALHLEGGAAVTRRRAAAAALAEVRRLEALWSRYRPDSLVSRINAAAGRAGPVAVDAETAALLDFGARLHAASGGRFDLTSGVLRQVWDFRRARLPDPAALQSALARVGWARVHWDGRHIALPEPGMEIDLGGIAKEYAADRAAGVLLSHGVAAGFVNLAGDLRIAGPRADGRPWQLGVRDPRRPDRLLAGVALTQGALATSGDYERGFEHGGCRYHHLLDATTGWPARGWRSVSVVAPVCTAAGALATLAMLGGAAAPALLSAEPVSWMGVDEAGAVHHVAWPSPVAPACATAAASDRALSA